MHIHEHLQVHMLWYEHRKRQKSKLLLKFSGEGMADLHIFL